MEELLIKTLPQLSVGTVAIVAIVYIVITLSKGHQQERQLSEKFFRDYVDANNHKITDLVVASTVAIKETGVLVKSASENINKNNEILEKFYNRL